MWVPEHRLPKVQLAVSAETEMAITDKQSLHEIKKPSRCGLMVSFFTAYLLTIL
jgi:hypothetical protein